MVRHFTSSPRRFAATCVSVWACLALAGCGGGDGTPDTQAQAAPTAPAGTATPPAPAAPATTTPPAPATPPTVNGTAAVSWTPPTQNTDNSALNNLAGYRVYHGTSAANLSNRIQVANPGLTSYVVTGLPSGTHFFAVSAYTTDGTESDRSNVGTKVVP